MPIGYDNESGKCLPNPDFDNGDWYVDAQGALFIVPHNGEIEGPDGATLDALNSAYRVVDFYDVNQDEMARRLGLEGIYSWQHRFDSTRGYYHV